MQCRDTRYTVLAEHSHYWGMGWERGRATEGVAPTDHWYLAEGSTWGFDEWITLFNPSDQPAWVTLALDLPSDAAQQRRVTIAEGPGRRRMHVNDLLGPPPTMPRCSPPWWRGAPRPRSSSSAR